MIESWKAYRFFMKIHDYFGVDIEKVWLTAKEDLPVLKEKAALILSELL